MNIPAQTEGGFSDTVSETEFDTAAEAVLHFQTVKKRFFDINSWELFAGQEKADFVLCDENDTLIFGLPEVQNFIKIKIPLLHNPAGDSFDWVQIEAVEEEKTADTETLYIRVRPCENPQKNDGKTAHFFKSEATSNFLIHRNGNKISAEVHGRNEIPNTEGLSVLGKVRNGIISVGGMIAGSKFQWKSLTDGLIKTDEK